MKVVIVTGLSGAGKTQAIISLEDWGYYCIDNMPPALIENFIELVAHDKNDIEKVAFVIDVRGCEFFDDAEKSLIELKKKDADCKIIFLEASEEVLIRRYNETRRNHPLSSPTMTNIEGIRKERESLQNIRKLADYVIDTSNMKSSKLRNEIMEIFTSEHNVNTFTVNIQSFGFKNGIPLDADMVFDMRFVPNPFYVASLKKLTGNSKKVQDYVMKHEEAKIFVKALDTMINQMIPCYIREGKYSLNLAFGCTGGQHRSVTFANEFANIFESQGKRVTLDHRDL